MSLCAVNPYFITGQMVEYIYDGLGDRVAKGNISSFSCDQTSNGFTATSNYIYGADAQQLAEYDGSGNIVHENVHQGGNLLATYSAGTSKWLYAFNDWLGTKRAQVGPDGSTSFLGFTSLPYGDNLSMSGVSATEDHFTGKDRDQESGNDYFGARYYSSKVGRFMSPDWALVPTPVPFATLNNPQSLNLYSYVGNNPMSKRDADGHHQECAPDKSTSSVVNGVQTVTVTAGACHEVSDGPWWLAFNPWGKLGGPVHRQTVQKLSEMLRNEGYDVQTEVKVPTPMGAKQTRYVDVVGVRKNTGETKMYQVGDRGKDGQPIAREKSALDDIEQATGVRPQFEDKSLGSQLENIEMGPTPSSMTTEGGAAEGDVVGEPESPIEIPPL